MSLSPDELAAKASVDGWQTQQYERVLGRQRAQADTAKLLVTFVLAVAATLTATALQVSSSIAGNVLDAIAVLAFTFAFAWAIYVVVLDDLQEPDLRFVDIQTALRGLNYQGKLAMILSIAKSTESRNERILGNIRAQVGRQLLLSVLTSILAVSSLLTPS